jgi:hypothetical protein
LRRFTVVIMVVADAAAHDRRLGNASYEDWRT